MALSPEQILALTVAPAQQAINSYGQGQVDLAKTMLLEKYRQQQQADQDARAMLMLGARMKAENQQLDTRLKAENEQFKNRLDAENAQHKAFLEASNSAALDKIKEENKAALERAKATEKIRGDQEDARATRSEIATTIKSIRAMNGAVPVRDVSDPEDEETDGEYLDRLQETETKLRKERNETHASVIGANLRDLSNIQKEIRTSAENQAKAAVTPDAFAQTLMLEDPKLQKNIDAYKKKNKGKTTLDALKALGYGDAYDTAMEAKTSEIQSRLAKNDDRITRKQAAIDAYTKMYPEAAVIALGKPDEAPATPPGTVPAAPTKPSSAAEKLVKARLGATQTISGTSPSGVSPAATRTLTTPQAGPDWDAGVGHFGQSQEEPLTAWDFLHSVKSDRVHAPNEPFYALGDKVAEMVGYPKEAPTLQIGGSTLYRKPGKAFANVIMGRPSDVLPGLNAEQVWNYITALPADQQSRLYRAALEGSGYPVLRAPARPALPTPQPMDTQPMDIINSEPAIDSEAVLGGAADAPLRQYGRMIGLNL